MKLGVIKILCAVFITFLIVALGSTARTQKPQGCNDPPWFNTEGKCNLKQHTYIFAGGVGWPKRNEKDCSLYIQVCSLHLNRKTIVPLLGSKCPDGKDLTQPTICCDEFDKAVKSKQPCDPMQDADCDRIPNDTDPDPLGARDPDTDHKCAQLDEDVNNAYRKAGAKTITGLAAGESAREDCTRRRHNKKCGIPTPDPPLGPPAWTRPPDKDDKCEQLSSDIHEVYLKNGASDRTAMYAAMAAREDCVKRRGLNQ
jgi:hypothetical protein